MRAHVLALAASCTVLFACVQQPPSSIDPSGGAGGTGGAGGAGGAGGNTGGAGGTGGGPTSEARTYFEERVSPIMEAECASCHASQYASTDVTNGPKFMGEAQPDYYVSLTARIDFVNADPGSSYLLTKGIHSGPAFDLEDASTVRTWLEMEADIKDPGGGGVEGPSGEELIALFVERMDYVDWTDSQIYRAADATTIHGKTCHGCHQVGLGGNYMTTPSSEASKLLGFEMMQSIYRISALVKAVPVIGADGKQRNELVQSCRWKDKAKNPGDHEKYILDSVYQGYVNDWFKRAMLRAFQVEVDSTCP